MDVRAFLSNPDMQTPLLVFGVSAVSMLVCGVLGSWVAAEKRRDTSEGFWLGFLLGPFGVLVELLLPVK